jgi:hypothetical protein
MTHHHDWVRPISQNARGKLGRLVGFWRKIKLVLAFWNTAIMALSKSRLQGGNTGR